MIKNGENEESEYLTAEDKDHSISFVKALKKNKIREKAYQKLLNEDSAT